MRQLTESKFSRVFAEQVRLLYKSAPLAHGVTLINGAILAYVLSDEVAPHAVLTWYGVLVAVTVARVWLAHRYAAVEPAPEEARRWNSAYVAGTAVAGFVWGAAAFALFPIESVAHQAFVAFVLAGMSAGSVTVLAFRMEACLAYLLPVLLTLLFRYLTLGSSLYMAMSAMTALFLIGMVVSAWSFNRSVLTSLRLRFDNRELEQEIGRRTEAEEALRESESRLALALRAGGTAVWEMDVRTQEMVGASDLLFTALGYEPGDLKTLPDWIAVMHDDDKEAMAENFGDVIEGRRDFYRRELRLRGRDGVWRWVLSQGTAAQRDAEGKALRLVGTHTDINEGKLAEQRIHEAALHDPLTGLPNRALVFEYGGHLLAAASRNHGSGALLFIDLDRFKPINDLYGHKVGDRVLQEVARRLVGCTRHEDLVGRLGGDEFVIFLPFVDDPRHSASVVARHVVDRLKSPFRINTLELSLSPSIGISHYLDHAREVGALIHAADLAMYQAKQSGPGNIMSYMPELERRADEAYSMEAKLKNALRHDGLELHYQPVIDIASGKATGAEALVRLTNGDGKLDGPGRFIPIAETAGLIGDVGEWVMTEACRQQKAWRADGLELRIAVNVSALQFRERSFPDRLGVILTKSGADPRCFQLELTESTLMESLDEVAGILNRIKSLGLTVALDDFGTGYSSLLSLSRLPLDTLKVDQSFVRRIESDQASRVVTEAIIALGRSLRLEVIGEGIESEGALDYLREHGCDQAQGYWFSKPLPAAEFARWCRDRRWH